MLRCCDLIILIFCFCVHIYIPRPRRTSGAKKKDYREKGIYDKDDQKAHKYALKVACKLMKLAHASEESGISLTTLHSRVSKIRQQMSDNVI